MQPINYDAAGLLFDIIPDKIWRYCPWDSKPHVTELDIQRHPHAKNVLETLGCTEHTNILLPTDNTPLFVEVELASYVFPYTDEIEGVVFVENKAYSDIIRNKYVDWHTEREKASPQTSFYVFTHKLVGRYKQAEFTILPRHPLLNMHLLY